MAAPTIPVISLDEYLSTSYHPDKEYVDGLLVERNVGTPAHSLWQAILIEYFRALRKQFGFQVLPECRTRITPTRFRVPDVTIVAIPYNRKGRFLDTVPLAIIEVLSPEDTMKGVLVRFREYEKHGVANIILMDPEDREAFVFSNGGLSQITNHTLQFPTGSAPFPVADLFVQLDD